MIRCPKCGASDIGGPRYRKASLGLMGDDWLEYWCRRCGYTEKTEPLDRRSDGTQVRKP